MNDSELAGTWAALEPSAIQRRRIDARVRGWLEAHDTSLLAEWLGLIKVDSIARLSVAAVAGGLVLIFTPLSWAAFAVL